MTVAYFIAGVVFGWVSGLFIMALADAASRRDDI